LFLLLNYVSLSSTNAQIPSIDWIKIVFNNSWNRMPSETEINNAFKRYQTVKSCSYADPRKMHCPWEKAPYFSNQVVFTSSCPHNHSAHAIILKYDYKTDKFHFGSVFLDHFYRDWQKEKKWGSMMEPDDLIYLSNGWLNLSNTRQSESNTESSNTSSDSGGDGSDDFDYDDDDDSLLWTTIIGLLTAAAILAARKRLKRKKKGATTKNGKGKRKRKSKKKENAEYIL